MLRALPAALLAALIAGAPAARAQTAETAVDLELVLAVDISLSMDEAALDLQRQGYVAAFRDPLVVAAIRAGPLGRIAVTYVEWAGTAWQNPLVPWTLIEDAADAAAFADRLAAAPLERRRRTSISSMLGRALRLLADNGYEGTQRKIDVSGDGPNNAGAPVDATRDLVVAQGVAINGLTILPAPGQPPGIFDIDNLDLYYEDCVIGGPGAFNLVVRGPGQFARAIRAKLLLEIAGTPQRPGTPRPVPAQFAPEAPRVDCGIGETLWDTFMAEP